MRQFEMSASDGHSVACFEWLPDGQPRGTVQLAHGMGEHAQRYDALALELAANGYAVFANDHRGHGLTATPDTYGVMGSDGWNRVIADAFELHLHIASAVPDVSRVLLGHSMGSMLARQFAYRHGAVLDALVLSGSPGIGPLPQTLFAQNVARIERARLGPDAHSSVLQRLLFGGANKPFDKPGATGFEWLSRDAKQVQQYIDDPACGFVIANDSLINLYSGALAAARPEACARIPARLPIYVLSGADDPVSNKGKNLQRMVQAYRHAGIRRVDLKQYPGGRHEMFNETNTKEVTNDLLEWLNSALKST